MKKVLTIVMLLIFSAVLYAQQNVTQFLGIPVDGSKSAMIQKSKAKGFKSSPFDPNVLEGEFNGRNVNLHVVTNNNKVYRIAVCDAYGTDETNIKIRFNTLCQQFMNNNKYIPVASSISEYILDDDENISFEMTVNKKRYEAAFLQMPTGNEYITFSDELKSYLQKLYTEEQLSNPTEEQQKDIDMAALTFLKAKCSYKSVWFLINEFSGKYFIFIYYDNELNRANGQDL